MQLGREGAGEQRDAWERPAGERGAASSWKPLCLAPRERNSSRSPLGQAGTGAGPWGAPPAEGGQSLAAPGAHSILPERTHLGGSRVYLPQASTTVAGGCGAQSPAPHTSSAVPSLGRGLSPAGTLRAGMRPRTRLTPHRAVNRGSQVVEAPWKNEPQQHQSGAGGGRRGQRGQQL